VICDGGGANAVAYALTALRPVDDPAFHTLAQTGVGKEISGGESKADAAADARS
jgi:hypothetical protein